MIRHIRSVRGIRSQPARAVWIEIAVPPTPGAGCWSQPARAVWIEIKMNSGKESVSSLSQPARAVRIRNIPGTRMSGRQNPVSGQRMWEVEQNKYR